MSKIKVSNTVAIPKDLQRKGKANSKPFSKELSKNARYPFATMRVGDSFVIEGKTNRQLATSAAANFSKRNNPGIRFVSATTKNGKFRVWRAS